MKKKFRRLKKFPPGLEWLKEGDTLIILEAMKMETPVVSPQDGTVEALHVQKGQTVQTGQLIVTIG